VRRRNRRDPGIERRERVDDHQRVAVGEDGHELLARVLREDEDRTVRRFTELVEQHDLAGMLVTRRP
jgi:hypothetical protein